MDAAFAEPTMQTTLVRSCGCVDTWMVYQLGAEEAETVIDVPCLPESCQQCQRDGMCQTRQQMVNYTPVEFRDVALGGPKKYRRLTA